MPVVASPPSTSGRRRRSLGIRSTSLRGQPASVINNGHTIMVNYDAGSYVAVDGQQFQLTQVHFHRPSEERIKGRTYPALIGATETGPATSLDPASA